jgi:hypothetical protein
MFEPGAVDSPPVSAVPRPLIAVLAVTVLAFVLWTVALKHTLVGGGSSNGRSNSPGAFQSDINAARGVQGLVNKNAAKAGGTPVQSAGNPAHTTPGGAPATTPTTASPSAPRTHSPARHPGSKSHPAAGTSTIASTASTSHPVASVPPASHAKINGIALVRQALDQHKVLALLFYNPAAPDDREVNSELSVIPGDGGKVVKLAIPVQETGTYATLLNQVPVNFSPTLVLINRAGQAQEITGFADSFEIAGRVAAALVSSPPKS